MADLITLTGTSVVEDESTGLQNSGTPVLQNGLVVEDNNDSDVALSNLATMPFSSRLFGAGGLGLNPASAIGLAHSAGNVVSITAGASLTDVGFTDANGAALNGFDSGIQTASGQEIFLYTDTENDIVLGRVGTSSGADPNGAVAFAVVLGETTTNSVVTGGEFWVVQFQPLHNLTAGGPTDGATASTAGAHDDVLSLANKLFLKASQEIVFSDFSKAPSGQNDWLGFGPTGSTANTQILVTGLHPLEAGNNQAGDTVNTSTIGLGSNSQAVSPGEGMRIDFVNGLNLPPQGGGTGDTKDIFGINYGAHVQATGAGFQLVQVQGGPNNRVDVRVTAYSTADEKGQDFVDPGIGNDTTVNIGAVEVKDATGKIVETSDGKVNDANIVITITGGVAVVTGLKANYSVTVHSATGAGTFDRFTVENVSSGNTKDFDVGAIRLLDVGSQVAQVGSQVKFEDDGPSAALSLLSGAEVRVDETGLTSASTVHTTVSAATLFGGTSAFGADGPAGGAAASGTAYALTLGAVTDSGLVDTASNAHVLLSKVGNDIVGTAGAGGPEVFRVSIDGTTGAVTLTQSRAIVHPNVNDPDEASNPRSVAAGEIGVTRTLTDGDGDTAAASVDISQILKFQDDGPSATLTLKTGAELRVDESGLASATDVHVTGSASDLFSGTGAFGADGPAGGNAGTATTYALQLTGTASGLKDTLTGQDVVLATDGNDIVGKVGANVVFRVAIDSSGAVTLTQYRAMVHSNPNDPDEASSPLSVAAGHISVTRTLTDGDGDHAAGSVDIGQILKFEDDGPTAPTPTSAALTNSAGSSDTEALGFLAHTGVDKPGAIAFNGTNGTALTGSINGGAAEALTSGGSAIFLFGFGTGTLTATTDSTGADTTKTVFTVTLNPATDQYTVHMVGAIDNGAAVIFNDFSGVPSGQQQWIGLNDPRPVGENLNQDVMFTGLSLSASSFDTVNTSQTGLGSNNQSVVPGKAIRIDFVTNLDVTTGNFKNLGTATFDGHYTVHDAGFLVSQTQSNAAVVARVSVYDEKVSGSTLNTDLTNDAKEAITSITVKDAQGHVVIDHVAVDTTLASGVAVDFLAGNLDVDVRGLKAGWEVLADTADGFQRMLVQNSGKLATPNVNKSFDLGGVVLSEQHTGDPIDLSFGLKLTDGDGDSATGSLGVHLNALAASLQSTAFNDHLLG